MVKITKYFTLSLMFSASLPEWFLLKLRPGDSRGSQPAHPPPHGLHQRPPLAAAASRLLRPHWAQQITSVVGDEGVDAIEVRGVSRDVSTDSNHIF